LVQTGRGEGVPALEPQGLPQNSRPLSVHFRAQASKPTSASKAQMTDEDCPSDIVTMNPPQFPAWTVHEAAPVGGP
jgi:hypothetical protein